jgi:anaerobic magnesium-protoporphyrin IX monomethyl ester cyclase
MNDLNNQINGKRVLMLFPPFHEHFYGEKWKKSESPFAPLGINYLATPLVKAGYKVNIVDLQVDHLNETKYFNNYSNTDFILISCFTFAYNSIQKIIHDIRKTNDKAVIICGGPYCNETHREIDNSDVTVFGEADLMITQILDLISEHKSFDGMPGICYKQNGSLIKNSGLLKVDNLDHIDPPLFDLTTNKGYGYVYGVKIKNLYPIISTRGCPFKCAFCTFQNVQYRERSVNNVIEEIRLRVNSGAKYIIFCDDNFLLNRNRVNEILDSIIQNNFKIKIIIQGRVDIIDYELCLKMKKANVIMLIFGIESVNQDVLNFYNKKTTIEKISKVIEIANSFGIITSSGVIIGAPIEQMHHFENTINFFKKAPQDFINVNILRYQYPSPLWIKANILGLINDDDMFVYTNEKLSNFSFEELLIIQKRIIKSFFNNPKRILRFIKKLTKHFGLLVIIKILIIYLGKSIYRAPQDFHR